MKEATGELNMTVITVVAIAAIAGIFYAWVWPTIQVSIAKNTCASECGGKDKVGASITAAMVKSQKDNIDCACKD